MPSSGSSAFCREGPAWRSRRSSRGHLGGARGLRRLRSPLARALRYVLAVTPSYVFGAGLVELLRIIEPVLDVGLDALLALVPVVFAGDGLAQRRCRRRSLRPATDRPSLLLDRGGQRARAYRSPAQIRSPAMTLSNTELNSASRDRSLSARPGTSTCMTGITPGPPTVTRYRSPLAAGRISWLG